MGITRTVRRGTRRIGIVAVVLGMLASGLVNTSAEAAPQQVALLECTTRSECTGGRRIDLQDLRERRAQRMLALPNRIGLLQ